MARTARQALSALIAGEGCAPAIRLLMFAVCFGCGCTSSPPRPASPTPVAAPTQSQSTFLGLISNTDPHAVRLDVRALPCGDSVRGHCVLIATVVDEQGKPLRGKRVEWTLEGAGQILAADDRAALLTSRGKLESRYAVTDTGRSTQRVARNTGRPEDDIVLDTGETWCMITSAVEGESHVTVFAPDVANPDANRVFVKHRWFDTAYTLPPLQGGRPGDRVALATRVYHPADSQPLPGYWVRYRYLDGPMVLLLPNGAHEALVISDAAGLASTAVYQPTPLGGRTRLAIEVLRPDPRSATAPPIIVGTGETAVDWQAPAIALTHTGPITVPVGQQATFTIAVRNNAAAGTPAYTVRAALPDGAEFVSSNPQAIRDGNNLIWTLGTLAGGTTRQLQVIVRSARLGPLTSRASVLTAEGLHDEQTVTTDVVAPPAAKLEATLSVPTTAILTQGVNGNGSLPVACLVTIRNLGTAPATNVQLSALIRADIFDHETKKNPVEIAVGTLRAGETRTVALPLTPRTPGETPIGVTVRGDGGLVAKAEPRNLKVIETSVVLKLTGPSVRFVGRPAEWKLEVKNTGQVPLQQVVVRDLLPAELQFVEAPDARVNGNEVVWDVGVLQSNDVRILKLVTKCVRPATKTTNTAFVSSLALTGTQGLLATKAEAALVIQGVEALNLKVTDKIDPVHVGERTGYTIQVTNQGSLESQRVQVVGKIPPQMSVVAVWGPGAYRVVKDRLEFQPVDRLPPGAILNYVIDVVTTKAGDARFRAELTSASLKEPVVKEESTMVR